MENIRGINAMSAAQAIQQNNQAAKRSESAAAASSQGSDTVEISMQARIASTLASTPDVRSDLVARVRGEIESGAYETPEKMQAALENLLSEL